MAKKQTAKPMGRPTKFTAETREKAIQAIQMGATYELAAQYAGISYDSFNNWMNKGSVDTDGDYFDFFNGVKEAEGKAVIGWLVKIEKAATNGNWQAAAWKLERRYPKVYGRTVNEQEHSGELKINVEYVKPRADNT